MEITYSKADAPIPRSHRGYETTDENPAPRPGFSYAEIPMMDQLFGHTGYENPQTWSFPSTTDRAQYNSAPVASDFDPGPSWEGIEMPVDGGHQYFMDQPAINPEQWGMEDAKFQPTSQTSSWGGALYQAPWLSGIGQGSATDLSTCKLEAPTACQPSMPNTSCLPQQNRYILPRSTVVYTTAPSLSRPFAGSQEQQCLVELKNEKHDNGARMITLGPGEHKSRREKQQARAPSPPRRRNNTATRAVSTIDPATGWWGIGQGSATDLSTGELEAQTACQPSTTDTSWLPQNDSYVSPKSTILWQELEQFSIKGSEVVRTTPKQRRRRRKACYPCYTRSLKCEFAVGSDTLQCDRCKASSSKCKRRED